MELVYRFAALVTRAFALFGGHKVYRVGSDRIPARGGAVIAMNHISYIDFLLSGLEMKRTDRRYVRFLGKVELHENLILRLLMNACKAIPVDRSLGHHAYAEAVKQLQGGELVGVFVEATISRSFELKAFKSGAARMALEAGVPIIPVIVWGSQRIATKGHPRALGRTKTPVAVGVGPAIAPAGDAASLTATMHAEMEELLHRVQETYGDHPAGEFWVPARLGGAAPTLEEADAMDLAERDEKERRRAELRERHNR